MTTSSPCVCCCFVQSGSSCSYEYKLGAPLIVGYAMASGRYIRSIASNLFRLDRIQKINSRFVKKYETGFQFFNVCLVFASLAASLLLTVCWCWCPPLHTNARHSPSLGQLRNLSFQFDSR